MGARGLAGYGVGLRTTRLDNGGKPKIPGSNPGGPAKIDYLVDLGKTTVLGEVC